MLVSNSLNRKYFSTSNVVSHGRVLHNGQFYKSGSCATQWTNSHYVSDKKIVNVWDKRSFEGNFCIGREMEYLVGNLQYPSASVMTLELIHKMLNMGNIMNNLSYKLVVCLFYVR